MKLPGPDGHNNSGECYQRKSVTKQLACGAALRKTNDHRLCINDTEYGIPIKKMKSFRKLNPYFTLMSLAIYTPSPFGKEF